jgi:hypothetical protein
MAFRAGGEPELTLSRAVSDNAGPIAKLARRDPFFPSPEASMRMIHALLPKVRNAAFAAFAGILVTAAASQAQRPEDIVELDDEKPKAPEEERVLEIGKWYPSIEAGLTFTQSAYSDNWSGSDTGSLTWAAFTNSTFEKQVSPSFNWWNSAKLAFGQTHSQSREPGGDLSWDEPDKSTDQIDVETLGRFTLGRWADPYFGLRMESQFQDLSDPFGRDVLFNPVRLRESVGLSRQWIDTERRWIVSRFGLAARQNFRNMFTSPPPSEETSLEVTSDGGIEFVTDARVKILEDKVAWTSRLGFYQPFISSVKNDFEDLSAAQIAAAGLDSDIADYATEVDIEFENIFTTQITKIVSVNLYLRWVYDKYENSVKPLVDDAGNLTNPEGVGAAVRKGGQFKQTLGLGLSYRFK